MAIKAKNDYILFAFDPYKWIDEGIKIAQDNNLRIDNISNVSRSSTDMVDGKTYNKYGYDSSSPLTALQQFDINSGLGSFLDQSLINDVSAMYQNIAAKLDLGGDAKASRIKFTDRPLGIFSFAQASKGLIRPVEYYSLDEKKLIKADLVFSGTLGNTKYDYYLKNGNEVLVQKRQEGTTKMIENCPDLVLAFDESSKMYLPYDSMGKKVVSCGGFRLRFTSTVKKVYAYREKKGGGVAPYVDLYIASGQNWSYDPEQMLIQAMPNILLARVLEKSGVKVRIFAYYNQEINDGGALSFNKFFMIKNYGEPIDLNKICVFLADTRFFRYWMWNAASGWNYKMIGREIAGGGTFGNNGRMMGTEEFNVQIMPFVRNYVDYQIKTGSFPSQVVDKRLMLFGGLNVSYNAKFNDNRTQDLITRKFYALIDYVQLQLSKTPKVVFQEIIKRERANNRTDYDIKNYLIDAITSVLTPTEEIAKTTPAKLKEKLDKGKITQQDYDEQLRILIQLDTAEEADKTIDGRKALLSLLNNLIP